jgi:pimeloyl-ACP methyl ester carboxylesterase
MDLPDTQYVKSGDGYLAYQVCGDGPNDVVYLPAWVSHVEENWSFLSGSGRFLRSLASFSRLIMFDLRGTGLSDPVAISEMTSLERWKDETLVVLDAVGSRQATLIGYGGGGPLAMLFAATHPDRTRALVLSRAAARFTSAPDYPWGLAPERVPAYLDQIEQNWGTGAQFARALDLSWDGTDLLRELGRAERYRAGPAAYTAAMRMALESDVRDILSSINVPTLVLHQTGGRFVPVEHSRYLAEHISNARYVEVPSYLEAPDAVANTIAEFLTGTKPAPPSDRVLATLLFTDIVDSTRRAATLGDRRWHQLLDDYDELTARQIASFRGRVNTTGDGFLATFDGPARAIRCALAVSSASRQLGIEIRAGLHTGEIETRGRDVAGIAVHLAARVAALSAPSEVLVSRTVKDLVAGSDLVFDDRGSHSLKGIPDDWHLYGVVP